jgi:hypothetical protein
MSVKRFIPDFKIKIRPKPVASMQAQNLRTLSTENAQILKAEAEQTKDEKLKDVLNRLASHARQD